MPAYRQGTIFKKFKSNNKFMNAVSDFKVSKTTINFKILLISILKSENLTFLSFI